MGLLRCKIALALAQQGSLNVEDQLLVERSLLLAELSPSQEVRHDVR